jgi:hypothetical protein
MSDLAVGDVVQIDPEYAPNYGACFLVVTEVKSWGVQGYTRAPGPGGGDVYLRVPFASCVRIGVAEWVHERDAARGDESGQT